MKKILVIIDGMQDEPIPAFNGKTPLEEAYMPFLDKMRIEGRISRHTTVPDGQEPATDVALLNILGYKLQREFSSRSWFEALGAGIEVNENDLCLRCNLISHSDNTILSHCGMGITDEISKLELEILKNNFENDRFHLYHLGGFRNILVIKNCKAMVKCNAPHNLLGSGTNNLQILSDDKEIEGKINNIIRQSLVLLKDFPSNGISLWAPGKDPHLSRKIKGTVIAGTPLVKGIGRATGMNVVKIEGATGDENTDLKKKIAAAFEAIGHEDFVLLHVEAPDEFSHRRDPIGKKHFLEKIDREVFSSLVKDFSGITIRVQADHATSSLTGKHLMQEIEVIEYRNL